MKVLVYSSARGGTGWTASPSTPRLAEAIREYAEALRLDEAGKNETLRQLQSAFAGAFLCDKPNVVLLISPNETAALRMLDTLANVRPLVILRCC